MNEFKDSLSVLRENSGKIIITDTLKNLLIELIKGNMSKQELMNLTGIADKKTVEIKIQEMVAENPELVMLYEEYMSRKSINFDGYNFRPEAIEMLRNDYSQSFMAEKIGINRRSYSTKMKKLAEENKENILGKLLYEHASRQMKRQVVEPSELVKINMTLDKYEEEFPVGIPQFERGNTLEKRKEIVSKVIETIEDLLENGCTLKELSEKGIISESSYRKYREEAENLSKILEDKSKGEK